ncbi:nitroreductase family protein [Clostridium sp. YIM B02515]|uniref:Nitroreductase family protein n=1 Tax=Clostridium rhizosphaerae TaxID=2803861 RepID=A0ABS1T984_9CLOT|nr:nitroreductase family protein [Clostridium rhizosphaerae]MBL4935904.1 nitroreductase family protein [Clostridium rhizosphaerae]
MAELKNIIEERRSANNFIKGIKILKQDFIDIFEMLKLAPSCFNIQHANYLVITDEEKKEALREAAFNQYKIHTASAAIIVLGDKEAYKKADKIYSGMLNLRMLSQFDYDNMLNDINSMYEGRGELFQRDEAIRNASLSAMMFMLIAKDKGWDTCPMIGFDSEKVRELFNIPINLEPVMLITMGKEDTTKRRFRGYRKPVGEFVVFEEFK